MRQVLVIGGAGFIGSHLVARCLERGDRVAVGLRPGSDTSRLAGLAVDRRTFDPGDRRSVERLAAEVRPDEVYHLAAGTRRSPDDGPARVAAEDLTPLLLILEALAALPRPPTAFVRAGSLAEYGGAPPPFREDEREAPLTAYAAALVAGTHFCAMLQPQLPFQAVTARLALTYGPRQSTAFLIPHLIEELSAGRPVALANPCHRRDLLFVDDAVAGLLALARPQPALRGAVVNLASGTAPTVAEIAEAVCLAIGADGRLVRREGGTARPGSVADFSATVDRARTLTGWSATTALADGLARTLAARLRKVA